MSKRQLTRYAMMLVLLMLSFTFATPTFACSPRRIPSLEERIDTADVVLIGTVVEVVPVDGGYVSARVEVESYLQGTGAAVVTIDGLVDGDNTITEYICNDSFFNPRIVVRGYRAIFLVGGEGETFHSPIIARHIPQQFIQTYRASDNAIAVVTTYINDPFRTLYRLERYIKRWTQRYHLVDMLPLLGLGFAGVLGIGFIVKRRRYNSQKPKRG
jgi:hypothetical protein